MKKQTLALLAAIGLLAIVASDSSAEPDRFQRQAIENLVVEFNRWIETNTGLKARPISTTSIRFVTPGEQLIADGENYVVHALNRGLYDPEAEIIYLVQPWDHRDPFDQSVLLHELIHHAQVDARHWYCPQAMEWDAYTWQEQWLASHDIDPRFNWTAILLESSCSKRDHHPD